MGYAISSFGRLEWFPLLSKRKMVTASFHTWLL